MAAQGRALSEPQIRKIISLLTSTELTLTEIAKRMRCSRSAVASINRKNAIRLYSSDRTWRIQPHKGLSN